MCLFNWKAAGKNITLIFWLFLKVLKNSWILPCEFRFTWNTLFCSFFCSVALRFGEITYAKKGTFPSGIFLSNVKRKKPYVLWDNEINEASHQPLVVRADTSILFIKKVIVDQLALIAQAIKALRGVKSIFYESSLRRRQLFFFSPVNISSSFWNQNIIIAGHSLDAAGAEINSSMSHWNPSSINKVPSVSEDSPIYRCSRR